jgi:hypothetical protein
MRLGSLQQSHIDSQSLRLAFANVSECLSERAATVRIALHDAAVVRTSGLAEPKAVVGRREG